MLDCYLLTQLVYFPGRKTHSQQSKCKLQRTGFALGKSDKSLVHAALADFSGTIYTTTTEQD